MTQNASQFCVKNTSPSGRGHTAPPPGDKCIKCPSGESRCLMKNHIGQGNTDNISFGEMMDNPLLPEICRWFDRLRLPCVHF